jgi:hypothetical protein
MAASVVILVGENTGAIEGKALLQQKNRRTVFGGSSSFREGAMLKTDQFDFYSFLRAKAQAA